jgi:hypothetical protein
MPQEMITTASETPAIPKARTADHVPYPEPESFSFADVERGDPDGAEVEAAVASWDGFL